MKTKPATASAGPPIRWIYRPLAIIATLILASCADYPVAISVQGEHGRYSYSAKNGFVITVEK